MIYLTGFHAIEERIKSGKPHGPILLAKAGPRAREILSLASAYKVRVDRVGTHSLDGLAPDHRGIALELPDDGPQADMSLGEFIETLGERKNVLVLILDNITDPHNYGAILRSCDQFGVDLVVSRNRRNAKYAEIISKTSAGAVDWVPAAETANLVRAAEDLKEAGFWIYGAETEGDPAPGVDLRGRTALVLGGEGDGISRLLAEHCDRMISIPTAGRIDSLNVSVAAGVLLYEATRQRRKQAPAKGRGSPADL
ncbi:MAG: 23S rRNA (guanosine(2251)-2'-O)-methyltransferase RlmB [Treponema sp.]|jgi:23S rRNA (guanosine2251-2'-O)-methyltransferase|nr:23S rRNA (guanosine(2251)-2'-O)-methyltransferase RlmB [Treponema sp.]